MQRWMGGRSRLARDHTTRWVADLGRHVHEQADRRAHRREPRRARGGAFRRAAGAGLRRSRSVIRASARRPLGAGARSGPDAASSGSSCSEGCAPQNTCSRCSLRWCICVAAIVAPANSSKATNYSQSTPAHIAAGTGGGASTVGGSYTCSSPGPNTSANDKSGTGIPPEDSSPSTRT